MSNLAAAAQALKNKPTINAANPQNFATVNITTNGRNTLMQEFQTAIKLKRKAQGLTQRTLARKVNLSQGTITRAECHGWVSIWTMLRIIDGLGGKITIT